MGFAADVQLTCTYVLASLSHLSRENNKEAVSKHHQLQPDPRSSPGGVAAADRTSDDGPLDFRVLRSKGPDFVHSNTHSLMCKPDEPRILAQNTRAAAIGVSESWLDDSVSDAEVEIRDASLCVVTDRVQVEVYVRTSGVTVPSTKEPISTTVLRWYG